MLVRDYTKKIERLLEDKQRKIVSPDVYMAVVHLLQPLNKDDFANVVDATTLYFEQQKLIARLNEEHKDYLKYEDIEDGFLTIVHQM